MLETTLDAFIILTSTSNQQNFLNFSKNDNFLKSIVVVVDIHIHTVH